MKFIPVIFCLALVTLIETTMQAKVFKPKPKLVESQTFKSPTLKHKLPEERRKLSLFPKSKKKFVVSEEPRSKVVTHSPAVLTRKKPLMKKILLQDKKPNTWNAIENQTKQPEITKNVFTNNLTAIQNLEADLISEEVSMEKDNESKENNKIRNDNKVAENILQTNNIELTTTASQITTKDYLNLKDFMLTPRNDPVEIDENKTDRNPSDSFRVNKNAKEVEKADLEEFIFLDPLSKTTEIVIINSESSEEFSTTDIPEEPIILRRRRSSNVIEEENQAPTVAGYKFTQKDTRLDNNMAFKNINS